MGKVQRLFEYLDRHRFWLVIWKFALTIWFIFLIWQAFWSVNPILAALAIYAWLAVALGDLMWALRYKLVKQP